MFKPGGLFGPKPGKAALDQAMGGSGSAAGSSGGSSGNSKDDKKGGDEKGYGGSGFDPRGLERAAKAAKVRVETRCCAVHIRVNSLCICSRLLCCFLKRFGLGCGAFCTQQVYTIYTAVNETQQLQADMDWSDLPVLWEEFS